MEETSEGSNHGENEDIDIGTADTTSCFPTARRVAFDLVWRTLTLGAAASAGWVRVSMVDELVPSSNRAPEALVVGLAPRVGGPIPLSKRASFWPRAGVTWVNTSASLPGRGRHLGLSCPFRRRCVREPESGGRRRDRARPDDDVPIAGMTHKLVAGGAYEPSSNARPIAVRQDYSFFSVGLSLGLLVFL